MSLCCQLSRPEKCSAATGISRKFWFHFFHLGALFGNKLVPIQPIERPTNGMTTRNFGSIFSYLGAVFGNELVPIQPIERPTNGMTIRSKLSVVNLIN